MILYFIPFERVGVFTLGSRIDSYSDMYDFEYSPKDESGFESFDIPDLGLYLFIENELIHSIKCNQELLYKGRNIIGMDINDFISHTNENYVGNIDELEFEDDGIPQYVYEFESIGLQIWVKKSKVITAIASIFIDDEEIPPHLAQG